ncbi:MAG TPA: hypothetical protein VI072_01395 [Polyangiaceae bacterium]
MPDVPTTPPAPGTTRVIIDANGERMEVRERLKETSVHGTVYTNGVAGSLYGYAATHKPVCITPCAVDMKPGSHVLEFQGETYERRSELQIQVGERPKVIRHAVGRIESEGDGSFWLGYLLTLGIGAVVTGSMIHVLNTEDSADYTKAANIALGAGAATIAVSIPLRLLAQPVHQPSSTTEMILPGNR